MNEEKLKELGLAVITGEFVRSDEKSLLQLEAMVGATLPDDYRDFLRHFGNSLFEKDVHFRYAQPSPWSVDGRGTIEVLYGLKSDSANIAQKFLRFSSEHPSSQLLPIGHDGGANLICLGLDNNHFGKVLFWDKETINIYVVANNFSAFIDSFELAG